MAHAIKDPRLNSQRSTLWLANQIMWPCEWAYIVINRWLLLLLLDYSLALFSVSAGEFVLRLMAEEQKIKTPSARDAPADNKGCEFARSSLVCSCVYATWLCCSFSSFKLSISTVFGLFLTSVQSESQGSCKGWSLAIGAVSMVAPFSGAGE